MKTRYPYLSPRRFSATTARPKAWETSKTLLGLGLLAATTWLSACAPDEADDGEHDDGASEESSGEGTGEPDGSEAEITPPTMRPDAPDYAHRGPHAVGYSEQTLDDGHGHSERLRFWYPAAAEPSEGFSIRYPTRLGAIQLEGNQINEVLGQALQDAPVDGNYGPYPLVVFSHGYGLDAPWYAPLIEHYASYGFVVVAPEHIESDWLQAAQATIERPKVIRRTLDAVAGLAATDPGWSGRINLEQTAVVGHSFGGYTALAMAGARFELNSFNDRCAELGQGDPRAFVCAPFVGQEANMAAQAGLDAVPTDLWPALGDARIKAIVPIAGDAYLFNQAGLAHIDVPMMAIGGTADWGTPWDWGPQMAYDHVSSPHRALVGLEGADHMIPVTPCEQMPWTAALPDFERGLVCLDPVWDKQRALDLIHHYSTVFLLATLSGDSAAMATLTDESMVPAGIRYHHQRMRIADARR